ncbi:MAG: hypothetical protein JWN62_3792 [Acidimicrobiales bacterium]|nr:hypothetical protein [Acidimicrobiales bacterium]
MQVTGRATWIVIGCAAAMLSACTSSAGDQALNLGTTSAPSTTVAIATTSAPTTTPPTTVALTTYPPTVAESTTVVESTTTTEPAPAPTAPPSKEDQVRADFESGRVARHQCAFTPETCDFGAIAIEGSPMDVRTRAQMFMRLKYNLRAVLGRGDESIRVDSVGFEGNFAFVTICDLDSVEIYDVADPENADDDILYNGDVASTKVRWEMHFDGHRWLLFQGAELARLDGGDLCGY